MRINDFSKNYEIILEFNNKNPNWNKWSQDIIEVITKSKYKDSLRVFEHNFKNLTLFRDFDPAKAKDLVKNLIETSLNNCQPDNRYFNKLPREQKDIDYILQLIKSGDFVVEDAQAKMTPSVSSDSLDSQVMMQQSYLPGSSFADTLTNFLVNIKTECPRLKQLQDEIFHDADLAAMIIPKEEIKEAHEILDILHADFDLLRESDELYKAEHVALIRSFQYNLDFNSLINSYIKKFKNNSLLEVSNLTKAAIKLDEALSYKKTKLSKDTIVLAEAAYNSIDSSILLNEYEKIFKNSELTINEEDNLTPIGKKIVDNIDAKQVPLLAEQFANSMYNFKEAYNFSQDLISFYKQLFEVDTKEIEKPLYHKISAAKKFNKSFALYTPDADVEEQVLWAKNYIDKNINKVTDQKDAYKLLNFIEDRVEKIFSGSDDKMTKFYEDFKVKFKTSLGRYIIYQSKVFKKSLQEADVKKFPVKYKQKSSNDNIASQHKPSSTPPEEKLKIKRPKVRKEEVSLIEIAEAFKDVIDLNDMTEQNLVEEIEQKLYDTLAYYKKNRADFFHVFRSKYGEHFFQYIRLKALEDYHAASGQNERFRPEEEEFDFELTEDVVDFPIDKVKSSQSTETPGEIINFPKQKQSVKPSYLEAELEKFVDYIKQTIDRKASVGEIRSWAEATDLLIQFRHQMDRKFIGYVPEEVRDYILNEFMLKYDAGMYEYMEHAAENAGYQFIDNDSQTNESFTVSTKTMINESISNLTASKCRTSLCKILRKVTDSANISLMNNFESYEKTDKISLKLGVYETSFKRLEKIKEFVEEQLIKDGWLHKDGRFIKGDYDTGVMVILYPIKKAFRSGPYKNRETPMLGIEVLGSKKHQKD